jgi:hypothetical protein
MFGRLIDQAGEECDALFRLDPSDPVKVDAAGVEVTSRRNRPDLDRAPFVKAKKDINILRGLSVAAAMHATFVFQPILTAAIILGLRGIRPIGTCGQMRARESRDLIPDPELLVRVTHSIHRCSEILLHWLGFELRIAYLRLLRRQGRSECDEQERGDRSIYRSSHGHPPIC